MAPYYSSSWAGDVLHQETLKRVHRSVEKARTLLQEIIEVYRAKEGLFKREQFSIHEVLRTAFRDAIEVLRPDVADALYKAGNRDDFDRVLRDDGMCIEVNGKYGSELFTHDQRKVTQIIRLVLYRSHPTAVRYRIGRNGCAGVTSREDRTEVLNN